MSNSNFKNFKCVFNNEKDDGLGNSEMSIPLKKSIEDSDSLFATLCSNESIVPKSELAMPINSCGEDLADQDILRSNFGSDFVSAGDLNKASDFLTMDFLCDKVCCQNTFEEVSLSFNLVL